MVINGGKYGHRLISEDIADLADKLNILIDNGIDRIGLQDAYDYVLEHFNII